MYSVIPAGIAVHMFHEATPGLALIALGGAMLYCAASGAFFYRGLRRYESGNVIVTKL
jgi:ABC-2 type transport system permease protein